MSNKYKVAGQPFYNQGKPMSDYISLTCESDNNNNVSITADIGSDPHISRVLYELKRYLVAIGYDWVEAVHAVAKCESTGSVIVHSSDDALASDDDDDDDLNRLYS